LERVNDFKTNKHKQISSLKLEERERERVVKFVIRVRKSWRAAGVVRSSNT
jgi:hypothetical protein